MNRLPVVPHLMHEEIDRCYRSCSDAAEKSRWHVLWLVTHPEHPVSATAAARLVGFTPAWGRTLLKRYNAGGPQALTDGRRNNGATFKLTPPQQAELFAALQKPPADHGLWSGPKVAAFVQDRFGITIVKQTGWQWLKELGFRLAVPRPRHPKAATPFEKQVWL
jgi:transposase